jgi:hypothetical protein
MDFSKGFGSVQFIFPVWFGFSVSGLRNRNQIFF